MKLKLKSVFIVTMILLLIAPALGAAIKYGDVTIKKGNVVIVRNHRMLLFTAQNNPVTVYENDTIRTLKGTALTLTNPDQHRIHLGANAIMQLKKWKKKEKTGTLRMLFGKFRAKTATLRKTRGLNLRTATATIGVKGSLGDGSTNPDFTSLENQGGSMSISTNIGEDYDVSEGQRGYLIDSVDQMVNFEPIPGFDPSSSEDQRENENLDSLDTDSSKKAEIPESIKDAIRRRVVDVAAAEGKTLTQEEVERAVPDTREELTDFIGDAMDAAVGTGTKVDVNVTVED